MRRTHTLLSTRYKKGNIKRDIREIRCTFNSLLLHKHLYWMASKCQLRAVAIHWFVTCIEISNCAYNFVHYTFHMWFGFFFLIIIPYVIKTWPYSHLCYGLSFKISGFKESNVYNAITISLLLPISLTYYQINYKVLIIINVWIM